jgi:lipopolysaccharide/colanic/teichoic acid biosynthesis glycosyltransferase
MRGDILFVGNRPMDPELAFAVTEEWQRTRFKCQSGFISILDTNEAERMTEEEESIAEGYYAVNRNLMMDLGIAFDAAKRILARLFGRAKVKREIRPAITPEQSS